MDKVSREKRSWTMSRVRARDTAPERALRSHLHRMGYRFTLCRTDLPGKPDIVLPKHAAVVFVHGCFWHRHPRCARASTPQTHAIYWSGKFRNNVLRDGRNAKELQQMGWRVFIAWECEIAANPVRVAQAIDHELHKEESRSSPFPVTRGQQLALARSARTNKVCLKQ